MGEEMIIANSNVIYFHSEGGYIDTDSGDLVVRSANLIDFYLEVIRQAGMGTVIFPRVEVDNRVTFKLSDGCSLVQVPVYYGGNVLNRLYLIFRYPIFLLSKNNLNMIRNATHCVSIGYDFFGTVAAIIRVYIVKKKHTYVVRGNRPKTVRTSSSTFLKKNFTLLRLKLYDLIMRKMVRNGHADIWFQGQEKYVEFCQEMSSDCSERLHVLNAVLRDLPAIQTLAKKTDLVFLGHINIEKGLIDLLEALQLLKEKGKIVTIRIVGMGTDVELVREKAHTLGVSEQIDWGGYAFSTEMVVQELLSAKLFVLPSHTEGLPRAMIESMAVGTPVLVTAVGGIPYVIKDAVNGFLVLPKKSYNLAMGIQRALDCFDCGDINNIVKNASEDSKEFCFESRAKFFLNNSIGGR